MVIFVPAGHVPVSKAERPALTLQGLTVKAMVLRYQAHMGDYEECFPDPRFIDSLIADINRLAAGSVHHEPCAVTGPGKVRRAAP